MTKNGWILLYSTFTIEIFDLFINSDSTWKHNTVRNFKTLKNHLIEYSDFTNTKITFASIDKSFLDELADYFTNVKKHNAKKFHFNNDELKAITKIHKYTLPKSYYYLKTKERNRYDAMYDIPLHLFIERFENADFRDIRNKRNEIPHFVYGIIYYFYNDVCSEGNNMRKKWYTEVATTLNVDKDKIRTKGHNFYKELYQNLKNK